MTPPTNSISTRSIFARSQLVRSGHHVFMGLVLGGAVLGILALGLGAGPVAAQEDQVAARVNGEEVLLSDVEAAYRALPPNVRQRGFAAIYPQLLERMLARKVVIDRAVSDVDRDADYNERLEQLEEQLLYEVFLTRQLESQMDEANLRAEYDRWLAENPPQQEVRARHILLEDEQTAKDVLKQVEQGAPFADLAREHSKGPSASAGGDLGWFPKGAMVPEFEQVVFQMQPNTYWPEPVKTQFGWHLILVEDKIEVSPPTYEEVRPALIQQLGQQQAIQLSRDIMAESEIERFDLNGDPMQAPQQPQQ